MSVINGALASAISHAVASKASQAQTASSGSGSGFGSATNVTLSAPAQAAVSGQPPAPPAGGGIPIATSSSSTDSSLLVAIADAQVIPKVGVAGASLVVDSKGDIDQVKLTELVNQQAEQAAEQKSAT